MAGAATIMTTECSCGRSRSGIFGNGSDSSRCGLKKQDDSTDVCITLADLQIIWLQIPYQLCYNFTQEKVYRILEEYLNIEPIDDHQPIECHIYRIKVSIQVTNMLYVVL